MQGGYIKRLFDDTLSFVLRSKGAVVVEGPKWCGKTTTCKRYAKEIVDLMPLKTRDELILGRQAGILGYSIVWMKA